MRAPSSRAGVISMSSSPSPSDSGSAYVVRSASASGVCAPELRRSEGVRCEWGRETDPKPVLGLVMSTSTGGEVSQASGVQIREPTLREPEWHEMHTVWKESGTTVDELAELGHSFNEMGVD
jgi:hypothetical protein